MKIFSVIFIIAVLMIGLVWFLTNQPKETPELPVDENPPSVPIPDEDPKDNWNWVWSDISPQGTQFLYPDPLPTKYVTAENWPPQVSLTAGEFTCEESDFFSEVTVNKNLEKRLIKNQEYCVTVASEGAAGSTYTTYDYATKQGDFIVSVNFTLRTPQCLNYDEPERSACQAEQDNLDVDGLADRMLSNLRMH